MTERNRLICLLTKIVPLPFKTIVVIAEKLVEHGVIIVVRCKDCDNYNTKGCADGFGWCEAWDNAQMDNHYCNFGGRNRNG
jgi:hypothetical protein